MYDNAPCWREKIYTGYSRESRGGSRNYPCEAGVRAQFALRVIAAIKAQLGVLPFYPPMTITREELDQALDIVEAGINSPD
ncbi:MAG: hypothetical protein GY815_06505 [Gammaproteobacteria bacterium]|nr:hypothetical protein [Gammaproteobacteria bacterium]